MSNGINLPIAAITKFSSVDWPGRLAAVLFLQGCPWSCIYCQNPWLQARTEGECAWSEVEAFLSKRKGLLDGVVFSGGEPTLAGELKPAIARVKSMGFAVGLHTSGAYPGRLEDVLELLDWVGLDMKAPPTDAALYERVSGVKGAAERFLRAYGALKRSGVAFELRWTVHEAWCDEKAAQEAAAWLAAEKVEHFALQRFRRPPGLESPFDKPAADWPGEAILKPLKDAVADFVYRENL